MTDKSPKMDPITCALLLSKAQLECMQTVQTSLHELRSMLIHVLALESEIEGHTDVTPEAAKELISELVNTFVFTVPRLTAILDLPDPTEDNVHTEMRKITRRRNSTVRRLTIITDRYAAGYSKSKLIPWVWKHLPQDLVITFSPIIVSWISVALALNSVKAAGLAQVPADINKGFTESCDRMRIAFEEALLTTVTEPLTALQKDMAKSEERRFSNLLDEGVGEKEAYSDTMNYLEKQFQPLVGSKE